MFATQTRRRCVNCVLSVSVCVGLGVWSWQAAQAAPRTSHQRLEAVLVQVVVEFPEPSDAPTVCAVLASGMLCGGWDSIETT